MSGAGTLHVTVVGAGAVGRALGTNLAALGHRVRYGARDPERTADRLRATGLPDAEVAPIGSACRDADLVLLAVPFASVAEVVAGLELAPGQIVVDATNPFGQRIEEPSGAARVAALLPPQVALVKAFNVLGAEHMAAPPLPDGSRPLLPVASDDPGARATVAALATAMGFDAVEVGDLESAGVLEEVARFWGLLAFTGGRGRQVVLVAHRRGPA